MEETRTNEEPKEKSNEDILGLNKVDEMIGLDKLDF